MRGLFNTQGWLPHALCALLAGLLFSSAAPASTGATRKIDARAAALYNDGRLDRKQTIQSNAVTATATAVAPSIHFFDNPDYADHVLHQKSDDRIYVQVIASACNRDPGVAENITLTLHSWGSGTSDIEIVTARETSANSGVFRVAAGVPALDARQASLARSTVRSAGATVDNMPGNYVSASFSGCDGVDVSTQLMIDPDGEVFDAATGARVAGAGVTLIDVTGEGNGGHPGAPAKVYGYDGVSTAPSRIVTGADGAYSFPKVLPSVYRLAVEAPRAYSFPSKHKVSELPPEYVVIEPGSFGGKFPVNLTTGAVTLDVPLDPIPHGLAVQKSASRTTAEIADSVDYNVTVKNVGDLALDDVSVSDTLPIGFAYQPGSARLDGRPLADPKGGRGPQLQFALGALKHGESRLVRYRARVVAGALQGDGINRAQATATSPAATASNVAAVRVKVEPGVFSDQAFVLGTVYADCNANGLQDPGKAGVPGVRLYLEDGTFVVTDGKGRYSLYGLSPRTHVLKVDATTLPEAASLAPISQRHGGDGNSRFVDAHRGELERADFAIQGCSDGLMGVLAARRASLGELETGTALKTELKPNGAAPVADVRGLPAQGLVSELAAGSASRTPLAAAAAASGAAPASVLPDSVLPAEPARAAAPLPSLAEQNDNTLAFIDLADGQVVSRLPQAIRVKGRMGTTLVLAVNGTPLGDDRVGERAVAEDRAVELREYIGVTLRRGPNTLLLTEADPFGRVRASRELHVTVPGELARIVLTPAATRADADGQGRVGVRIELQDADGHAIADRVPVTLETTAGTWDTQDLDLRQPGVQTFIEGGSAALALIAPSAPGDAQLRATRGDVAGQAAIAFGPVLRPMLAAGIIEGALDLRKLDPKALVAARSDDGFERELRQYSRGDAGAGARAALFLKGKVRGDYLLTLGYDSDKPTHDGLFRDIQPDAFYPVYGDSSVRGFDAQSTGRLYVRVEKDKSYLLYGDYTTQALNPARQLGAYQRSLNGAKAHVETERVVANAFASHDSTRQVVEELRADGTSGPFTLGTPNIVDNSEKVEILTRDRNQPALIIKTVPLTRFTDYDFDPLSGRLLMRAPVASVDSDLNPMSIRVTMEVDQGGPAFWVGGADAQVKVTEQLEVGGSAVKDYNPEAPFQLASANATWKFAETTQATAEAARTEHDLGAGNAERMEFLHESGALKARLYGARSDIGFANPSATISSGRSEGGAKVSYALDERTRLTLDALHTGDVTSGARRDGVLAGVERSFDGGTKVELGARAVRQSGSLGGQGDGETTSVRAKATTAVPGIPLASVFVEAEQDVRDADKRLLAIGGDYQIANQGRVYLRHELISSITGPYALDSTQRRNTTVLGVDAEVMDGGRLFSEYRGQDAFEGRGTEAAIGLRNRWSLADGLRVNTSFERVQPISGTRGDASAAVTGAVEYTANPLWKGTARLELRDGADTRGALSTLGLARKINDDWTFLGKNVVAVTQSKSEQPTQLQERLQLGVAYRDTQTHRVNALGRYEFKHERGGLDAEGAARSVHTVSAHADLQADRQWLVTAHGAAKLAFEKADGQTVRSDALLVSTRATYDFGNRWDAGVAVSMLATGRLASRQSAAGGEVGYMVDKNLWVSAGYNVTGFKDRDLSPENYTSRGAYLRLRFKFDENLFSRRPT
jgi:uncharacterized repeat protein (TIGR01451 family)